MKLFFTIFGAILAAAAVIVGLSALDGKRKNDQAAAMKMVDSMLRTAGTSLEMSREGELLPSLLDWHLQEPERFGDALDRARVDPGERRAHISTYRTAWEMTIDNLQTRKVQEEFASRMAKALEALDRPAR